MGNKAWILNFDSLQALSGMDLKPIKSHFKKVGHSYILSSKNKFLILAQNDPDFPYLSEVIYLS